MTVYLVQGQDYGAPQAETRAETEAHFKALADKEVPMTQDINGIPAERYNELFGKAKELLDGRNQVGRLDERMDAGLMLGGLGWITTAYLILPMFLFPDDVPGLVILRTFSASFAGLGTFAVIDGSWCCLKRASIKKRVRELEGDRDLPLVRSRRRRGELVGIEAAEGAVFEVRQQDYGF